MSSKTNIALYVDEDAQFSVQRGTHHEDIAPNELLIETHYSGVNPADVKHSTQLGIRATVIGYDFCGVVLKSFPGSQYKEGDLVAGYTPSGLGRLLKYGAHQSFLAVPEDMIFKVPDNLPAAHAAALTVVTMTAADALYNLFKFPLPTNPGSISAPILIWGASAGVGQAAVQFARASGYQNILVTASPGRHEALKTVGATLTFDYASATVITDIISAVKALGQGPITHALDAAGTTGSADLMIQSVSDSVSLASVVLRPGGKFRMPVAGTKDDWKIHVPGSPGPMAIPARPADHWRSWDALKWAVDNYGTAFKLLSVDVLEVTGEEALEATQDVASGKRGFGKVVFRHPLK
ncbi:uncharacterized protein CTRU02_203260 [Colletotrichum truncatum]|uniref:Uncharacterized protein n=1 Tax=Colletotrichum truncatum TaxID=5467 RepID=A0ACC3Z8T6_COLTU|nr:uncharacterized protein CTRU02_09101 [Colletotrichum truncatum]KAF6789309.1 hypothetical protein CTRU02_09101 [Colletotrichum truncatum]